MLTSSDSHDIISKLRLRNSDISVNNSWKRTKLSEKEKNFLKRKNNLKKFLTKQIRNDKMSELNTTEKEKNKHFSKKLKKVLDKVKTT